MGVKITSFGKTPDGQPVSLIILRNKNGMSVRLMDFGACLVSVLVPDRSGTLVDVALGYDSAGEYAGSGLFFGGTVGRNANRIANARFVLGGVKYHLAANDGKHNLHSMPDGYHLRLWDFTVYEEALRVIFRLLSRHMDQGFPGNLDVSVTYALTEDNGVVIHYHGIADRDTLVNMTNHTYFNLAGHGAGSILGHVLTVNADAFLPIDETCIPTGEIRPVAGTPFDFRAPAQIGSRIHLPEEQLLCGKGYDHNFVLNTERSASGYPGLHLCAKVEEDASGRLMEVYTDQPGMQLYTGNFIAEPSGKGGAAYVRHSGFCLETQRYPDTPNHPYFPTTILPAGVPYDTVTVYQFGIS